MADDICVLVNPAAGRGRARRMLPEIQRSFGRLVEETLGAGDEVRLTHQALAGGAQVIVCVGGDGTATKVADTLVRESSNCALAVVPCGTGNDFAKTLGLERCGPAEIADIVALGDAKRIDVGRADGHYFLNSCGFGFDASVLEASRSVRFLKGDAVYIYSALLQLFTYRGVDVSLDHAPERERLLMVTVSNGQYLGGAFKIAPTAAVNDAKLDVVYVGDCSVAQRVRLFAAAMRGTHVGLPMVRTEKVERLLLEFTAAPDMEVDGELRRAKSARVEIECVPSALSVIAAPGALL